MAFKTVSKQLDCEVDKRDYVESFFKKQNKITTEHSELVFNKNLKYIQYRKKKDRIVMT